MGIKLQDQLANNREFDCSKTILGEDDEAPAFPKMSPIRFANAIGKMILDCTISFKDVVQLFSSMGTHPIMMELGRLSVHFGQHSYKPCIYDNIEGCFQDSG